MFSWLKKRPDNFDQESLPRKIEAFIESSGVGAALDTESRNFASYLNHYKMQATLVSYHSVFQHLVVGTLGPKPATALDYGCWYGLSSVMLSSYGIKVTGFDINAHALTRGRRMIAAIGANDVTLDHCEAFLGAPEAYPADFAMIMDVLCSAHPDEHERILGAMVAAVAPSGWLFISDANNRRDSTTMAMLRKRWFDYEIGDGTLEQPNGHYFRLRCEQISRLYPTLESTAVAKFARESCYLWGLALKQHVEGLIRNTNKPVVFDPEGSTAPVRAFDGCTFGTALDPSIFLSILRGHGLHAELRSSLTGEPVPPDLEADYNLAHYFIVARHLS